ncbi:MAG TPA: response regulator transcription factor [Candidatus Avamphibacillus intestinigallinarum]|nr:response regulator transcription factor [Candidatus Avamphibacillus intestinigallinarum]
MLHAFVVEDEKFAREELKFLLEKTKQISVIGEAESIHEALWHIHESQPDVVFLDIELAKGNGLDLANQFSNMKKQPMIVFATAYDQYALDAFELGALDYIVKPIEEKRLEQTVQRLLKQAQAQKVKPSTATAPPEEINILAKDEDRTAVLQARNIIYVGTENRQTFIKTAQNKYSTDALLYQIKEKLPDYFEQVHRGYIVNLKQVDAIEPWFNRAQLLILKDGSKIPVSRSYTKEVKQKLGF